MEQVGSKEGAGREQRGSKIPCHPPDTMDTGIQMVAGHPELLQ